MIACCLRIFLFYSIALISDITILVDGIKHQLLYYSIIFIDLLCKIFFIMKLENSEGSPSKFKVLLEF